MVSIVIISCHGSHRNQEVSQLSPLRENHCLDFSGRRTHPVVERHFICHSGRDDGYGRLAGTGLHSASCLGDETEIQVIPEGEIVR